MNIMEILEKEHDKQAEYIKEYEAAGSMEEKQAIASEKYKQSQMRIETACRKTGQYETARKIAWVYPIMRDCGNKAINFDDFDKNQVNELVAFMRENGVKEFTFSSTWSSAIEISMEFVNAGCELTGMREINSIHKKFMSDEFEVIPAYVFAVK